MTGQNEERVERWNGLKSLEFRRFGNEKALFLWVGKGRWRRIVDSQLHAEGLAVFQRKSSYRPTALPLKLPLFSACREDLQAGVSGLTSVLWISRLRHVADLMGESTF